MRVGSFRRGTRLGLMVVAALTFCGLTLGTSAALAAPPSPFFNGFETDNAGWDVFGGNLDATRVPSGTNGVTSATGSFHAEAAQDAGGSAATNWGGYSDTFPSGGYTTSVDIYLDTNCPADDTRFDFTSAINDSSGNHRRDFAFNAGCYTGLLPVRGSTRGVLLDHFTISAGNNTGRANSFPENPDHDPFDIYTSGWYTFEQHFYDNGGVLAVDLSIIDSTDITLHTWTLSDPGDTIATTGGNRYGWFANQEFPFLAFDNSELAVAVEVADCFGSPSTGSPTNGDDVLIGTADPDAINALRGDDKVCSLESADNIAGGADDDQMDGGDGGDTIHAGDGHDTVSGADGDDAVSGGPNADDLSGDGDNDTLNGNKGHDDIDGGAGDDTLIGNEGQDTLDGGPGTDTCTGGPGVDTFINCEVITDGPT